MGAVVENMVLVSEFVDTQIGWEFQKFKNDPAIFAVAEFDDPYTAVNEKFRGHSLFERHTNRFPYSGKEIEKVILDALIDQKQEAAEVLCFSNKAARTEIAELVKRASSMRFQIREVHEWFADTLRFTPNQIERGDGLDVNTIPLPPGGKKLLDYTSSWKRMSRLNRLGIYKLFSAIEAQPIASAPLLLAILSPQETVEQFNAGRLLERVWCYLNARGLAVHPYFVITDQLERYREGRLDKKLNAIGQSLSERAEKLWGGEGKSLQMLLRVGYPKTQPARSRRLEISKVTTVA